MTLKLVNQVTKPSHKTKNASTLKYLRAWTTHVQFIGAISIDHLKYYTTCRYKNEAFKSNHILITMSNKRNQRCTTEYTMNPTSNLQDLTIHKVIVSP